MQTIIIEFVRKYIGQTGLYAIVFLIAGGVGYAYAIENVVTYDALAEQIDTVRASATIDRVELEQSILRKEESELLDRLDDGKMKPRHKIRLKEVTERLKVLDSLKTNAVEKLRRIK